MANAATAQNSEAQPAQPRAQEAAPSGTVKVRIKHGRLLVGRTPAKFGPKGELLEESGDERYAEAGEIVDVPRKWAEKLLARQFDGYPSKTTNGAPGIEPGIVRDSPIELVH